jgi:L-threonylcarbamoyladenylate synthase
MDVDTVVAAVRAGKPVLLPTDTVYGICVDPYREESARRLYRAKGREERQPIALVASDLDLLFECLPELRGRAGTIARALLPGPYTLVFPNPARRYRWLTGSRPDTIGLRVPELEGAARRVLERVGAVAATSANEPGGAPPARLDEVPKAIRDACAAEVDGGQLPGVASTVVDLTGPEPVVLREGAGSAEQVLSTIQGPVREMTQDAWQAPRAAGPRPRSRQ